MVKLLISERRLIAIHHQYGKKSPIQIVRMGFTERQVRRWKSVNFVGPDSDFEDAARDGAPHVLTSAQEAKVMEFLERDEPDIVTRAAQHFKVSPMTIRRIGHTYGSLVTRHREIHVSDAHALTRVPYAESQLLEDHSKKCWGDHTLLTVPPEPVRQRVWRSHDSIKPVPTAKRWKSKVKFLMFVAAGGDGSLSDPIFATHRVRRRYTTAAGARGTYRWETFTVDAAQMRRDLVAHVFPFMQDHDLDELILDNAPCQDGLLGFIDDNGFKSPGFAAARRHHCCGYPPNSPDCMLLDAAVFGRFKVLYAHANPKTIPEAMSAARRIIRRMQGVGQKWLNDLDELYVEIIDKEGLGSHHMVD